MIYLFRSTISIFLHMESNCQSFMNELKYLIKLWNEQFVFIAVWLGCSFALFFTIQLHGFGPSALFDFLLEQPSILLCPWPASAWLSSTNTLIRKKNVFWIEFTLIKNSFNTRCNIYLAEMSDLHAAEAMIWSIKHIHVM